MVVLVWYNNAVNYSHIKLKIETYDNQIIDVQCIGVSPWNSESEFYKFGNNLYYLERRFIDHVLITGNVNCIVNKIKQIDVESKKFLFLLTMEKVEYYKIDNQTTSIPCIVNFPSKNKTFCNL